MASTYSSNLKVELMADGEKAGTWGGVTNTNIGTTLEEAIVGKADVDFATDEDKTITLTDSNASQDARNIYLNVTSSVSLTATRELIVPTNEKTFIVKNGTSGSQSITVKTSAGTGITVPNGSTYLLYVDGTNVVEQQVASSVASGGTGRSSITSGNIMIGAGTDQVTLVGAGTTGNVLVANGTSWESGVAFVSGMIMLWSGSIASIPTGWVLCDGTNSTPDLRNNFVVGAGDTYSVDDTGGSADAVVVSHTHTFSGTTGSGGSHSHTYSWYRTGGQDGSPTFVGRQSQAGDSLVSGTTSTVGNHTHSFSGTTASQGESGTNKNLPPYYALAYIMKT